MRMDTIRPTKTSTASPSADCGDNGVMEKPMSTMAESLKKQRKEGMR